MPRAGCDVDFLPSCNLSSPNRLPRCGRVERPPISAARILLCLTLQRAGRIVYDPAVIVLHHRRALFWGHFRQVWNYAVHRGFLAKHIPSARDPRYFVPLAFLAAHAGLVALPVAPKWLRGVALGLAATYAGLVVHDARRAQRELDVDPLTVAAGIYLTHLLYGAGVAYGWPRGGSSTDHPAALARRSFAFYRRHVAWLSWWDVGDQTVPYILDRAPPGSTPCSLGILTRFAFSTVAGA